MAYFSQVKSYPDLDLFRAIYNGVTPDGKTIESFSIPCRRTSFSGTTALEDLAQFLTGTTLPTPTGAESWEVVSSSANDTSAGTGTRSVEIHYLDNSWLPQTTTVTMNGTTPVSVAALANCRAINWIHTKTVGSGGAAAGNILLRIAGAGATHDQITAGGNQSLTGRFTVPDGYFAVVDRWSASCSTNHSQDVRLRGTVERDTRDLLSGIFLFQDIIAIDHNSFAKECSPFIFPPRSEIKISTITSNVAANVSASFGLYLIEI